VLEEIGPLEGTNQAFPGDLVGPQTRDVFPLGNNLSIGRGEKPGYDVEEGGLPGPVGADQSQDFPGGQAEAHPAQGRQPPEMLADVFNFQNHKK
jgi:hypothetical protein